MQYHSNMQIRVPLTKTEIAAAILIGLFFVLSAYLSDLYRDALHEIIGMYGMYGMLMYVGVTIVAIIIAPVSATPLIPIATTLWGPVVAGVLSLIGWVVGAVIAFWLARTYGYECVGKFVRLRKMQLYAAHISHNNLFWTVVLLRLVLPVDVLSYALGLFSTMPLGMYTLATVIGVAPFAFIFSYVSEMPLWVQGIVLMVVGMLLYAGYQQMRSGIARQTENERADDKK